MAQSLFGLLKEMFERMVVRKDPSLISDYYHPEFLLFTNGESWNFERFEKSHKEIYLTPIRYKIRYDEETIVEGKNKLAARVFISTTMPGDTPKEIEVILIAQYRDQKIYRLWELTYPDWSKMPEFEDIE